MSSSNNLVVTSFERPKKKLVESLRYLPVANIADAMGKPCKMTMNSNITPAFRDIHLVGPAVTVKESPDCNLMSHVAIDLMKEGDVLVVDAGGYTASAVGGFLMSRKMISKKAEGVVIDGAWRDLNEIMKHRFPVFSKAWTPGGPHKDLPGSVNVPVSCGGVVVKPGDIIVGDDDGLCVIPLDLVTEVIAKANEIHDRETSIISDTRKEVIEAPSPYASSERLRNMGIKVI